MNAVQTELRFAARALAMPADLPPEVRAIVLHLHANCTGRDRMQTAIQIAAAVGISGADPGRRVRLLISLYQDRLPVPVCAQGGYGYYVATDPADLTHYERSLHALLRSVASRIARARRNYARCGLVRIGSGPRVAYQAPLKPPSMAQNPPPF